MRYWSFSFSISPSNEYSGLIAFRMDWLDFLAVQGTLKSLLQHHSSKASILRHSAFFIIQLSHPYMTTGKTIALTRQTFVGKAKSLLFNILSRLVIAFLPRSKSLLISWLQSPSAVILEPKKIKFYTVFIVSPSICHEVVGLDGMILVIWMLSFKPAFLLSSFACIKRLFSSAIRVVSSAYLRLLIFLPAILIPAYASSSLAFCIMYSPKFEMSRYLHYENYILYHILSLIIFQKIVNSLKRKTILYSCVRFPMFPTFVFYYKWDTLFVWKGDFLLLPDFPHSIFYLVVKTIIKKSLTKLITETQEFTFQGLY